MLRRLKNKSFRYGVFYFHHDRTCMIVKIKCIREPEYSIGSIVTISVNDEEMDHKAEIIDLHGEFIII